MEEYVGSLWHRFITRFAYRGYPEAAVSLEEMAKIIPLFFRALGGDPGLSVKSATAVAHGARRSLAQRIAGSFKKAEFAWQDDKTLYLPASIELFPQRTLNQELFFWLAALATCDVAPELPWFTRSQQAVLTALEHFPGWRSGRIAAVKPGFYTRMGTAIRYATRQLAQQRAARRLLLLLTDGKPNDLDQYEGRYGIEDTRIAVLEARRQGLTPFCITIDRQAGDYLPHLFGPGGYVVVRRAAELPRELPRLYAQLTR